MAKLKLVASSRWSVLHSNRSQHLARQRKCAELTLPSLLPPEGATENTPLPTPWQSMGARCVNNLASKIVLTLMPPNSPCMRFLVSEVIKADMAKAGVSDRLSEIEENLALREWEVQTFMEKSRIRVPSFRIMRLLIVTGNALMQRHNSGSLKVFRLDQYVVRRDGMSKPVEIVVKEPIDLADVPRACLGPNKQNELPSSTNTDADALDLFTYCLRNSAGTWSVHQEINDKLVPGSQGEYEDAQFPFRPLVWNLSDGENYGRGHVEEHLGDLIALEELSKAVVESTAAGAKLVFLVNPNGVTLKKDLINAQNGGFVVGQEGDVVPLRVEKMHDMQIAGQTIQKLVEALSFAFLLHTSIQRSGERVTAEEIRFMAQDIEDSLGGIYSVLAQEYQLPLVEWALASMSEQKLLEKLPEGISVSITTGIEALGRGHDMAKLQSFMSQISVFGPEVIMQYINVPEYFRRAATANSLNTSGLVKSPEELAQEQQRSQQQMAMQSVQDALINSPNIREYAKADAGNIAGNQPQQE